MTYLAIIKYKDFYCSKSFNNQAKAETIYRQLM